MQTPQFLLDLLQLLLDLAVPAAFCTLAAAGVNLRHEGGMNFHVNGRTGKWILWTIVLLTLPQLLSWVAAQGINIPSASGSVGTSWLASMETVFKNFVNQIVVAKLVPVLAAYFVLKATLDGAAGENPLGSIVAALFLMSLSATMQLYSGVEFGRTVRDDRYARLPVELYRRADLASRGGTGLCRSGHQFRAAQTLDQACLRRDLFPEREWPSLAVSGDGGVRSML